MSILPHNLPIVSNLIRLVEFASCTTMSSSLHLDFHLPKALVVSLHTAWDLARPCRSSPSPTSSSPTLRPRRCFASYQSTLSKTGCQSLTIGFQLEANTPEFQRLEWMLNVEIFKFMF